MVPFADVVQCRKNRSLPRLHLPCLLPQLVQLQFPLHGPVLAASSLIFGLLGQLSGLISLILGRLCALIGLAGFALRLLSLALRPIGLTLCLLGLILGHNGLLASLLRLLVGLIGLVLRQLRLMRDLTRLLLRLPGQILRLLCILASILGFLPRFIDSQPQHLDIPDVVDVAALQVGHRVLCHVSFPPKWLSGQTRWTGPILTDTTTEYSNLHATI